MSADRTIPTQANTNVATFKILSNGEPIPETVGISLVTVSKCVNKIPTARLVLFDGDVTQEDFELSSGELFKPGNEIEIQMGYQSNEDMVFKGMIIKQGIEIITDQVVQIGVRIKRSGCKNDDRAEKPVF